MLLVSLIMLVVMQGRKTAQGAAKEGLKKCCGIIWVLLYALNVPRPTVNTNERRFCHMRVRRIYALVMHQFLIHNPSRRTATR